MKSVTKNVASDVLVRTICIPSSNMLGMRYHIVIKTLVKFTLINLCHDGHVY